MDVLPTSFGRSVLRYCLRSIIGKLRPISKNRYMRLELLFPENRKVWPEGVLPDRILSLRPFLEIHHGVSSLTFLEGFCPAGCLSHSSEEAEAELQSLAKRPGDDWPAGQSAPLNNTLPRSRHRSGAPRRRSDAYEITELRQPPSYAAKAPNLEPVIPRFSKGSRSGSITPP